MLKVLVKCLLSVGKASVRAAYVTWRVGGSLMDGSAGREGKGVVQLGLGEGE